MKTLLKSVGIGCVLLGLASASAQAATVAQWTFETSLPATAGPFAAEVNNTASAALASGYHAGASTYSSPVGDGSAKSFSSNTWAVGDYYQFQVDTTGDSGISLAWDQTSSGTGPRDFQLQYSTNGTSFTNFGSVYAVLANAAPNPVWTSANYQSVFHLFFDLSSITALDNVTNAYFRLADASTTSAAGGTVATAGTNRVDNFTVSAVTVSAVPLPGALALFLPGLGLLGAVARRRKA